jgi:hypothetical protein
MNFSIVMTVLALGTKATVGAPLRVSAAPEAAAALAADDGRPAAAAVEPTITKFVRSAESYCTRGKFHCGGHNHCVDNCNNCGDSSAMCNGECMWEREYGDSNRPRKCYYGGLNGGPSRGKYGVKCSVGSNHRAASCEQCYEGFGPEKLFPHLCNTKDCHKKDGEVGASSCTAKTV